MCDVRITKAMRSRFDSAGITPMAFYRTAHGMYCCTGKIGKMLALVLASSAEEAVSGLIDKMTGGL